MAHVETKRTVWGVVPAAGRGQRLRGLAFAKELLPTAGPDGPRAVIDYALERVFAGGATMAIVIASPNKTDLVRHVAGGAYAERVAIVIQPEPAGLCDAVFRAADIVRESDDVLIALPDTIWYPVGALGETAPDRLSLVGFESDTPHHFDSLLVDEAGAVRAVAVKADPPLSNVVWGAIAARGGSFDALHRLWRAGGAREVYLGAIIDAYVKSGNACSAVLAHGPYIDVGTLEGYRAAMSAPLPRASDA